VFITAARSCDATVTGVLLIVQAMRIVWVLARIVRVVAWVIWVLARIVWVRAGV
jgi:uncharacterized membrane protein YedE/YeeE